MLRDFFEKNRELLQLIYGLTLVVLIPALVVINSFLIINKYNDSIDEILQKQALSVGLVISDLMKNDLPWEYYVQQKIDSLMRTNIGIQEISIMRPENDFFNIVASSNKNLVGQKSDAYYYQLAWLQPKNEGLATDSWEITDSYLPQTSNKKLKNQERFWLVAAPMAGVSGQKEALLVIKLSSEIVDELTRYNQSNSIYILIITVFIVILFLLAAVRLWDYALLYKKIKEIDELKDEFVSMASHELKTPVSAIRGYSALMLENEIGKDKEKDKKCLQTIYDSSTRLMQLVKDLLEVGQIEQNKISINPEPVEISSLIKQVVEEFSMQAERKNLNICFDLHSPKLPKINIDPGRFKQILINLISNAIKYTEDGEITISAKESYAAKILEIIIKDTGMGISNADKEKLFAKFYRIKNEKTKKIIGTGLGLWITKQLVELMKGRIKIESIENIGTQVILQFPIVKNKNETNKHSQRTANL